MSGCVRPVIGGPFPMFPRSVIISQLYGVMIVGQGSRYISLWVESMFNEKRRYDHDSRTTRNETRNGRGIYWRFLIRIIIPDGASFRETGMINRRTSVFLGFRIVWKTVVLQTIGGDYFRTRAWECSTRVYMRIAALKLARGPSASEIAFVVSSDNDIIVFSAYVLRYPFSWAPIARTPNPR